MPEWFFTSDLHGQHALYEQTLDAVASRRPEALVIGGDLGPHAGGKDGPGHQRLFLQGFFVEFSRRVREASAHTELLLLMGNDDWASNADCLEVHDGDLWHLLHGRSRSTSGIEVAGLSWVPITPFKLKDWERWDDGADETPRRLEGYVSHSGRVESHRFDPAHRSPTITEALEELASTMNPSACILVTHSPPSETRCDLTTDRVHVGSRALRRFVETHQPPLVLSGHIHESPRISSSYRDAIGRTIVVNPGQFGTSRLCGVWFDPADPAATLSHSVFG